jgi:AcrR family transcriptional regulator
MKYQKIYKQKILEATAKVIAEKGLDKTSVDDIINEAKISKGSIYFHFKNKDELLIAGIKFTADQRISQIKEALKSITSPKEKLTKLFKANNLMLQKDRDSFLMTYALLLSSHTDIRKQVASEYLQRYINFVAEIIEAGVKIKEFVNINPIMIATTLVITSDITGIVNFSNEDFPSSEKIIKDLFNLILVKNGKE